MADLHTLLNPEDSRRLAAESTAPPAQPQAEVQYHFVEEQPNNPHHSTHSPQSTASPAPNTGEYTAPPVPSNLAHSKDHPPHPNCPNTLNCLPDSDGRPQHTLPVILRCAIMGSERQRLTIREIYAAMETKYPYYQTAGQTWKQSVRHHLSLNRLFERQPRPVTDPGFGSYWTVNLDAPPGTKRARKRGRANKDAEAGPSNPAEAGASAAASTSQPMPEPQKGRRGRPRKDAASEAPPMSWPAAAPVMRSNSPMPEPDPEGFNVPTLYPSDEDDYDGPEVEQQLQQTHAPNPNQNTMPPPPPPPPQPTPAGLNAVPPQPHPQSFPIPTMDQFPSQPVVIQPVASKYGDELEDPKAKIERLRIEVESLRRQSADAIDVTLKLTDQLTNVQAESNHMRSSIGELQDKISQEQRLRQEAERLAAEETARRLRVEQQLEEEMGRKGQQGQNGNDGAGPMFGIQVSAGAAPEQ